MTVDKAGDMMDGVHWTARPGRLFKEVYVAYPIDGPEVGEFPDYTVDFFTVEDWKDRPDSLESWNGVEPLYRMDGRTLYELVQLTEVFGWQAPTTK